MDPDSQVDVMIYALLESANDKQDDVRTVISKSLYKLGNKKPELMLEICHRYLEKHGKLTTGHRTIVLTAMAEVCRSRLSDIGPSLAKELIAFTVNEMIESKDVIPSWQGGASAILVALGHKFCYEVMESLHGKFQPGVVPHFFVVRTLGDLATDNVFGMVPFLKAILQTTLTIIGLVKHDNMRWVFAHGLARFSEAISEYLANIEKAPDPSVKKEVFSTELTVAYSTIFNSWLQSKEAKVRVAVVDAIGHISKLLSRDKLDEELARLVPGILTLYKRHNDHYFITQGLSMILDSAVNNGCMSLELHLDSILNCLFPQVCTIPDYTQPVAVKNHNEVLRCSAIVARAHSERIIAFLLQRVDNNSERIRIGSLTVLRHLVNSSETHISNKIATVLSGLKAVLNESNNKVKKVLAQVIVALAHHGYLELDSSQVMVEFIIQQCALPDEPKGRRPAVEFDYVSNNDLRSMCENILHLLTTTVDRMTTVFWPHILEFIVSEHLTSAIGVVCKSATYLATKQKDEQISDFEIDFDKHKNLPRPVQLIARMLVMLGHPMVRDNRGLHILRLMKVLIPSLEKSLVAAWDSAIPKLTIYLEDSIEDMTKWSQKVWEESVLKLLADSLGEVDNQDWTISMGKTFGDQLPLYAYHPDDKNFLFKCAGVVLKKTSSKTLVSDLLELIVRNVNHAISSDREGCAAALGFCSSSHMDAVLVKLDQTARVDYGKKSGLFSFIMEMKGEAEHEIWRATIITCYGYVAVYSPSSLLIARVETPILRNVYPYFSQAKDPIIRASLIRMTEMVARAMHPTNLRERLPFRSKCELLRHMEVFIAAEKGLPLMTSTSALAIDACTALLKLDPVLPCDDRAPLLKTCYESVFPLPEFMAFKRSREDCLDESEEHDIILQATLDSLELLLKELLLQEVTPTNFYSLFVSIEPWLMSSQKVERERAIHSVLILSKCFLDNVNLLIGSPSTFDCQGAVIARLVPRCTDPTANVRELALETIYIILKAALRFDGFSLEHQDASVNVLQELKHQALACEDATVLYNVTSELARVISAKLSVSQLRQFLDVLMEGLNDLQAHSSAGTCVVLNNVLKLKAGVLQQELETLIQLLHSRLNEISCSQTYKATVQIIWTLAGFQLKTVLTSLLSYPLPFDKHMAEWWRILASDHQLSSSITEQFCEALLRSPPYSEHPDPRNKKETIRIANSKTLAVVYALREMFAVPEMEVTARKEFERLFTSLLVMVGSYVEVYPPSVIQENPKDPKGKPVIVIQSAKAAHIIPSKVAMEALRAFLVCTKCDSVLDDLVNSWDLLDSREANPSVVAAFAKSISVNYQCYLTGMVTYFNPMLSSMYDSQRIIAVAFFAELISHHSCLDQAALELLLNSMLGRLVDASHVVRRLAIRGLGSIGKLDVENMDTLEWFGVYKYSNTVLSAMLGGMDDKDDVNGDITLESMRGLCRVLADMDQSYVESSLINIILRVRSCFEKERAEIRAAAFNLFGVLSRFSNGSVADAFQEQLHINLVTILVHLNDDDKEVVKACKNALRSIGPLLGSETVKNMFQKHLIDASQLYYAEFIADLSKNLATDFADRMSLYVATCVAYFKSAWPTIKGNAAMFAGYLLASIPVELHSTLTNQSVFGALTLLLKDPSSEVRIKAAEAISGLYSY